MPAPTPAVPFVLVDDSVIRADSPVMMEDYDVDEDYDERKYDFISLFACFICIKS